MVKTNQKSIKEILKEGNKYKDVVDVLEGLMSTEHYNFPVSLYIDDDNHPSTSLSGEVVREQAAMLYSALGDDSVTLKELGNMNLYMLFMYADSHSNNLLHNYAVAAAHRCLSQHKNQEETLTNIRTWLTIQNMLVCSFNYDEQDPDGIHDWDIPEGWKHLQKDDIDIISADPGVE